MKERAIFNFFADIGEKIVFGRTPSYESQLRVQELIDSLKLERADILLIHTRRSLLSWAIRFGTKSYWNHVAMIYVIRHPPEYNNVFLIESAEHGVDLHHLKKYFSNLKKHDIGIKRLNNEWFKVNKEKREELQRHIRGITLDQIDQEYDYNLLLRLALRFTRYLVFGTGQVLRRLTGRSEKRVGIPRGFQVRSFICSGFAQYAYFEAVREAIMRDGLPKNSLLDVIFNESITNYLKDLIVAGSRFDGLREHLLSVIPKDFAGSEKLDWIYFIREGQVLESPSKQVVPV